MSAQLLVDISLVIICGALITAWFGVGLLLIALLVRGGL